MNIKLLQNFVKRNPEFTERVRIFLKIYRNEFKYAPEAVDKHMKLISLPSFQLLMKSDFFSSTKLRHKFQELVKFNTQGIERKIFKIFSKKKVYFDAIDEKIMFYQVLGEYRRLFLNSDYKDTMDVVDTMDNVDNVNRDNVDNVNVDNRNNNIDGNENLDFIAADYLYRLMYLNEKIEIELFLDTSIDLFLDFSGKNKLFYVLIFSDHLGTDYIHRLINEYRDRKEGEYRDVEQKNRRDSEQKDRRDSEQKDRRDNVSQDRNQDEYRDRNQAGSHRIEIHQKDRAKKRKLRNLKTKVENVCFLISLLPEPIFYKNLASILLYEDVTVQLLTFRFFACYHERDSERDDDKDSGNNKDSDISDANDGTYSNSNNSGILHSTKLVQSLLEESFRTKAMVNKVYLVFMKLLELVDLPVSLKLDVLYSWARYFLCNQMLPEFRNLVESLSLHSINDPELLVYQDVLRYLTGNADTGGYVDDTGGYVDDTRGYVDDTKGCVDNMNLMDAGRDYDNLRSRLLKLPRENPFARYTVDEILKCLMRY